MGKILSAKCKCGYEIGISFGRGMFVSTPTCLAPALCHNCMQIMELNYLKENITCKECGGNVLFYDDPRLKKSRIKSTSIRWRIDDKRDFVLPKRCLKCPKCSNFNLKFMEIGNWD